MQYRDIEKFETKEECFDALEQHINEMKEYDYYIDPRWIWCWPPCRGWDGFSQYCDCGRRKVDWIIYDGREVGCIYAYIVVSKVSSEDKVDILKNETDN
jgi:hypothetical protein